MTTTLDLTGLANTVLARFAVELHEAGTVQLEHLARRAEMPGEIGHRMQGLVDDERARRVFTAALTPSPPRGAISGRPSPAGDR